MAADELDLGVLLGPALAEEHLAALGVSVGEVPAEAALERRGHLPTGKAAVVHAAAAHLVGVRVRIRVRVRVRVGARVRVRV